MASSSKDAAAAAKRLAAVRRRQRVVESPTDDDEETKPSLMQESHSVGREAADLLASVRKGRRPTSPRQERSSSPVPPTTAKRSLFSTAPTKTTTTTTTTATKSSTRSDAQPATPPSSPKSSSLRSTSTASTTLAGRSPKTNRQTVENVNSSIKPTVTNEERPKVVVPPTTVQQPKAAAAEAAPATTPQQQQEDLRTVEEREPVLMSTRAARPDAACIVVVDPVRLHNRALAASFGGAEESSFKLVPALPKNSNGMATASKGGGSMASTTPDSMQALRYGQTIEIVSTARNNNKKLTVVNTTPELVASTTTMSPSYHQWTVLRAARGMDGLVRIGQAALDHDGPRSSRGLTAPVRSGDAIILRNVATGGLLSMDESGNAKLVTDSYNSSRNQSGSSEQEALLSRLQRHGLYIPSDREIFHPILATCPPIPLWITGSIRDKRIFLDGSYPFEEKRHEVPVAVERKLFGVSSRSNLSLEYSQQASQERAKQLETIRGQEQLLLDELLGSMLGLEGRYIKVFPSKVSGIYYEKSFRLDDSKDFAMDVGLRSLVSEVLPLSTAYIRVRHFVSSHLPGYEYGQVMQALCARLDLFLQEYVQYVASLDTQYRQSQGLELRQLLVDIRPTMHSMLILHQVTETVRCKKGGALLNSLRKLKSLLFEGDSSADFILSVLLDAAAVPYMKMLKDWVQFGLLADPHGEFMIRSAGEASPWESEYSIDNNNVLEGFFSPKKLMVTRILATGRYWNAIRQCEVHEGDNVDSEVVPLTYSTESSAVARLVLSMYNKASKILVRLLREEYNLLGSLRTLKRYFLLDQGDFFVNFMDSAEDELLKEAAVVSRGRIQHWLKSSIQLLEHQSEVARVSGPGKELHYSTIRCRFAKESLMDHLDNLHAASGGLDTHEAPTPLRHTYGGDSDVLTGLDAFLIEFSSVPFPISLVLSKPVMSSYTLLFRHLFFAKHVERRLVGMWLDHQAIKELQALRGSMGRAFLLRQRMLHFLQNLMYYLMLEVIEPSWDELEKAIFEKATAEQTIDDILECHAAFLFKTLEACLLTNRDLLRALTKLMTTCLLFSDQMKRFMLATQIEADNREVANEKRRLVQRNLNDRGSTRPAVSAKRLHQTLKKDVEERNERVKRQTGRVNREVSSESFARMIERFDEVFSDNLCDFMLQVKHSDELNHSHRVNLCTRLDYNGYVSMSLGLSAKSKQLFAAK